MMPHETRARMALKKIQSAVNLCNEMLGEIIGTTGGNKEIESNLVHELFEISVTAQDASKAIMEARD